ncbi:MAG: SRPBCC domain-containing protein [Anaerolineae bacterium]|nr:SRPBCC domain-containing protein [Anaerolineae bacterium]
MDELTVERNVWIKATRDRVWQAITTAEQIQQWWGGEDHWEISALQVGGVIKFGDPTDLMIATIAVCDPPRQFSIEWPPQAQYHTTAMTTTYILDEENGGTRVTVRETGFEALPDDIREKRFDSTSAGYEQVLADLKRYLEGEE